MIWKIVKGVLNNATSPGSVQQEIYHDFSRTQRGINAVPLTAEEIIADSSQQFSLVQHQMIRVVNTTNTLQFLAAGEFGNLPSPLSAANSYVLLPNSSEVFTVGAVESKIGIGAITSDSGVQVVKIVETVKK